LATIVNDGLSPVLFDALKRGRDEYTRTGDISTTSCIDSPRIRVLKERHDHEIVVNASTLIPSFVGTAVHTALERYPKTWEIDGVAMEKEFVIEVLGVKFSGRPDYYSLHDEEVGDFKNTSVYAYTSEPGGKHAHLMQAHINGYLIRQYGYPCRKGWIEMIFSDWKMKQSFFTKGYPKRVEMIHVDELKGDDQILAYIQERVALHMNANDLRDDELQHCTTAEQWKKADEWKVFKKGAARALKIHYSHESALAHAKSIRGAKIEVKHFPGEKTRCEFYCEVQQWCNQYREESMDV
jgi:hypothetical protein